MKFLSFALVACVLEFAASFTPSTTPRNNGVSPTRVYGVGKLFQKWMDTALSSLMCQIVLFFFPAYVDPDALQQIAQHGIDVARVLFLDCDQGECSMVEGTHAPDGWHFENRLGGVYESNNPGHTSKILMMEMEDTE
jgi:hypothetical protein